MMNFQMEWKDGGNHKEKIIAISIPKVRTSWIFFPKSTNKKSFQYGYFSPREFSVNTCPACFYTRLKLSRKPFLMGRNKLQF